MPEPDRPGIGFVSHVGCRGGRHRQSLGPWRWSSRPGCGKLALFVQLGPACGIDTLARRGPMRPMQELALSCRGLLHVQFAITAFPPSTCPSCRYGGIGFVSHACPQQWRHLGPCPPAPLRSRDRQIGFVLHNCPTGGTGDLAALVPYRRGGDWLCFARWVHGRLFFPTSNFTLQTSPIYTRPPITCRVA